MKIPYIKIPIADISAYLAPFSFEEKGKIFQAVLDFGLYQKWAALELSERGQIGYSNVQEIVENEIKSYKKFCKEQKQKIKNHWEKVKSADDTNVLPQRNNQTETKQETETDIYKKHTTASNAADSKPKSKRELNDLQKFSNAVLERFEDPMDDVQKGIWFRRNCRNLSDILNFCGKNISLGLETISVCVERLQKAGLSGGYEAVCRNLPEYMAQAKKKVEGVL
jgi:hypothetical protein